MTAPGLLITKLIVRLMYVAQNLSFIYLSFKTLQALGVVVGSFFRIEKKDRAEVADSSTEPSASLSPCTNSGVLEPTDKQCSCTACT